MVLQENKFDQRKKSLILRCFQIKRIMQKDFPDEMMFLLFFKARQRSGYDVVRQIVSSFGSTFLPIIGLIVVFINIFEILKF